jgi:hypothetical protein
MATQTCLRFASRIASNVQKWVVGDEELESGYTPQKSARVPVWHANVQEEDEEPYINPFTGQSIETRPSKTAGPSNKYDIYAKKELSTASESTGSSFDYGPEVGLSISW